MNGITHKEAMQWIGRRLDGLLNESQLHTLEEHLRSCDSCRAYATDMDGLAAHMQNEFHRRWSGQPGPSRNVMERVTAKARRIPRANRLSSGTRIVAGAITLILLAVTVNFVVSRLESTSQVANATETLGHAPRAEDRLLAFASEQNGNSDIYTVHADGSGLTNLTNHPANDSYPIWSPDGKHIAFESDRDGFRQIYLMNADSSNLVRLTNEEADHGLPLSYDGKYNPWSPDGSKLVFVQEDPGGETAAIYSVDVNGQNKVKLFGGKNLFGNISWSPDGNHIAFILNDSSTPRETYVPDIYIVDSDGNQLRELQSFLPEGETVAVTPYYWSSNGQSIVFTSYTMTNGPLRQTLYEFDVITHTFSNRTEIEPDVVEWRDGIVLRVEVNQDAMPYVWERPDGTTQTFEESKAWGETCSLDNTRSFEGDYAFGVYCPHDKFNLYLTNADGSTIKKILTLPVDLSTGGVGDIAWSQDDQYLAFNLATDEKTEMYVLKVEDALANPATEPLRLPVSDDKEYRIPVWQPVAEDEVVEENPTPAPTQDIASNAVLAFTSGQSGNLDIYTMHPDGSGLTNITNHPAGDSAPSWSPDGKRIAFESSRDGFTQIYSMNADGSDVIQLTHDEANHFLPINIHSTSNSWSPDGSKLLFLRRDAETSALYVLDLHTQEVMLLGAGRVQFNNLSWSPDGTYVGFVRNESLTPDAAFVAGLHIVDVTKGSSVSINDLLPQTDSLFNPSFYWSDDGSSLFFIAERNLQQGVLQWIAYEAILEGQQLIERATSSTPMQDWWEGTALSYTYGSGGGTLTWTRSDGTLRVFNPLEVCDLTPQGDYGFMPNRSPNGGQLIDVYCPNQESWFYYANADGTVIKPLTTSPIPSFAADHSITSVAWSADDGLVAFTLVSPTKSSLYLLNVNEPSIGTQEIVISDGELYTVPAWRPGPGDSGLDKTPPP